MKTTNDIIYYWPGIGIVAELPDYGGLFEVEAVEYLIVAERRKGSETTHLEKILVAMRQTPFANAMLVEQLNIEE